MKFGPVAIDDAVGAINAHSVALTKGRIGKGKFLDGDDIAALTKSGIKTIIVARLDAGDVHEDEAAATIAKALGGNNVEIAAAFTGRVNIFARSAGILTLSADLIHEVNGVHESITLATLHPGNRVSTGALVATIKIIPYGVERRNLERVTAILSGAGNNLDVAPFVAHKVGLVATMVDNTSDKMLDKTARLLTDRLHQLGSRLGAEIRCGHEVAAIAGAVSRLVDQGHDPVIIFGASAIVDRRDMVPSGIIAAGGTIDHFGMPVDPGNLLLLGHMGSVRIVGAPGCARSPAENGFDRVLEQMLARQDVQPQSLMGLGVGGLYKEIYSRPAPRRAVALEGPAKIFPFSFAIVILAAGQSRRMGAINKLLQDIDGKAMVRHVTDAAIASKADRVLVVTGHEQARLEAELAGVEAGFVHNPSFATGLSSSLKTGIAGLDDDFDGFLVCLGDMPGITTALLDRIMAAFDPSNEHLIIAPVFQKKRGNPVLFAARFKPAINDLEGDMGAKYLIGRNEDLVFEIEADDSVLLDVDTLDALEAVRDKSG